MARPRNTRERLSPSRLAWTRRVSLLGPARRDPLSRRFLHLIGDRSRQVFTVTEAARLLGVSRSVLERICLAAFQLPPGVLINLGRALSVARDLRDTGLSLKEISSGHAFPTPSIMNRFFTRYAGMGPGAYRSRVRTPGAWTMEDPARGREPMSARAPDGE